MENRCEEVSFTKQAKREGRRWEPLVNAVKQPLRSTSARSGTVHLRYRMAKMPRKGIIRVVP